MSGSGDGQTMCSWSINHCLQSNCSCFKTNLLCPGNCKCNGCRNAENNKAEVESLYQVYFKRKTLALDYNPRVPKDDSGCRCKRSKCACLKCSYFARSYKCTPKCKCQDCANRKGLVRSDTNTEQGKGGAGGVSNVPEEAVQATPSRDNGRSDSNKRPRNMGVMRGNAMKMVAMVCLALLFSTASAGRAGTLPPVRAASRNPKLPSVSGSVLGCSTPKLLARDIAIYCLEPRNVKTLIDDCCAVVVGTVGRPSCFCLVQKEPAFGMSDLYNVSNMAKMLSRCGALPDLKEAIYNPCQGDDRDEPPSPTTTPARRARYSSYKVSTYVGWVLLVVLMAAVLCVYLCRRRTPSAKQDIEMVTIIRERISDRTVEDHDVFDPAEEVLLEARKRRHRTPNPRVFGDSWVNYPARREAVKRYRRTEALVC